MTTIPAPKKSFSWSAVLVLLLVGLPLLACLCSAVIGLSMTGGETSSLVPAGDAVAVIYAEGIISSGSASSTTGAGGVTPSRIKADLRRAERDASVKAVVLRINSPGGSDVASNEIYKSLKDLTKPVVVSMGETAASGGYYIACATKWIVANPDTLTGSIGVISEFPNAEELLNKLGVQIIVIKSGPNKDIGSYSRPMTDDEKKLWQAVIDQAYDGFVQIVAEGRNLPEDKVRQIADGRVYTGKQAKELGLVDQLGYLDDAINKAGELGGISGKPRVVDYLPRPTLYELLLGASSRAPAISLEQILGFDAMPRLQYRFIGP